MEQTFLSNSSLFLTGCGLMEQLLKAGQISDIDFALTEHLLRPMLTKDEALATFICFLCLASRKGHLCVKVNRQSIFPEPAQLLADQNDGVEALSQFSLIQFQTLIQEGSQHPALKQLPIMQINDRTYLLRYWKLESDFIDAFSRFFQVAPSFDKQVWETQLSALLHEQHLTADQAQAISCAAEHNLTIMTGGPGTGKTYTAGYFLKLLWHSLPPEKRLNYRIALAAPTGKAAANLEASIGRALKDNADFPALSAQTLHGLLALSPSRRTPARTLSHDIVIVDECSMVDIQMMTHLFQSMKPSARLILLGDAHQLPSVDSGSVFLDLVNFFKSSEKTCGRVAELKTCLRSDLKSIIQLAQHINQGDKEEVIKTLEGANQGVQYFCFSKQEERKVQQKLLQQASSFNFDGADDYPALFKAFNQFRILSPLRKGELGVEVLNLLFLEECLKLTNHNLFVAPILITRNHHKLKLFNGEGGLLIRQKEGLRLKPSLEVGDFALFPEKSGEGFRKIPALLLPQFEYAYCLSIHKSQGSEFDHVLLVLPASCELSSRELLYTGVTRARKNIEVWGAKSTITEMLGRTSHKLSGITERNRGL